MFTKIKDSLKDTYLCNTFDLSKVDDWIKIKDNKTTFIKKDSAGIELLRYPGFIFTNTRAASYYYNNFYKLVENVFTPCLPVTVIKSSTLPATSLFVNQDLCIGNLLNNVPNCILFVANNIAMFV